MTNDIFCVGLTRTELQTLGTLLYSPDGSMCALRGRQPGQPNVRAVLRHSVPYKGLPPLRRLCVYPSALCGGNSLLVQTISVAESENPISLTRPSTENVGGLFLSIIYQSGGQNHARKRNRKAASRERKGGAGTAHPYQVRRAGLYSSG